MARIRGFVLSSALVAGLLVPVPGVAVAKEDSAPAAVTTPLRTSSPKAMPGSAGAPLDPAPAATAESQTPPARSRTVDKPQRQGDLSKAPRPRPAALSTGTAEPEVFDPATAALVDHTERADLYVTPDGTNVGRTRSRPVNYRDEDNRWRRIDTTVVRGGRGFRNAAGPLAFEFAGTTGDGPLVSLSRRDWRIAFEPVGLVRGKAATAHRNRLTYRDALPGADVEYHVLEESLKEIVRLRHRPRGGADASYRFPLRLTGVTARTAADGTIEFVDVDTDLVVASMPPGYAIDSGTSGSAAGDPAVAPVRTELVAAATGPAVDVTVDGAWLAAKERVYPVLIDPQVNAGRQTGHSDMYVSSAQPNTTFAQGLQSDGARYYLKIGYLNGVEYDSYSWYDTSFANGTAILRGYWSGHFYSGNASLPFTMWRLAEPFNANPAGGGTTFATRPNHFIGPYDRVKPIGCCGRLSGVDLTYWVALWTSGNANHGVIYDTGGDTRVYDVMAADEMAYIGEDSYIDVYYNKTPYVPYSLTPANGSVVTDRTPTLAATYQDADSPADNGSCTFEIYDASFALVSRFGSNPVTSGSRCTAESPALLGNGKTYYWKASSIDFHGARSAETAYQRFVVAAHPTLTKTVPAGPYSRGQLVRYTVTVANNTGNALPVTSISDTLGAGLDPASFSASVGGVLCGPATVPLTCAYGSGGTITTSGFTLAAGASQTLTVNAVALGTEANCSPADNAARADDEAGFVTAAAPAVQVCDARLGLESWWGYVNRGVGPQAAAAVNVSNGNLVLTHTDSTPVQAHGRLAFVLRRTYNSQDTAKLVFPGSWGAGWVLNVGEVEGAAGVTGAGLSVPSVETALRPLPVTLVDRDGTRHVFRPRALTTVNGAGGPIPVATVGSTGVVTSLVAGATSTLLPRVLTAAANATTICADQLYTAPKGVHLGLWRYIRVGSTAANACQSGVVPSLSPVVVGYAAVRPDRLRTEYSATGELLEMTDANGVSLKYVYDSAPVPGLTTIGKLKTVYEATSTCNASTLATPGACRAFRFGYPSTTENTVTDPAGRTTRYLFDGTAPTQLPVPATPPRLVTVVNPADASNVATSLGYSYGTCGVAGNAGTANQLCSATDARGNATQFSYTANVGPSGSSPYLARLTDRRGNATTFAYSAGTTTVSQGTHRQTFSGIDAAGRTTQVDEGDATTSLRRTTFTWDSPGCHAPDDVPDNDLCRTVVDSLYQTNPDGSYVLDQNGQPVPSATPDDDTARVFSNEGALLMETKGNGAATTSFGYRTQYVRSGGATACLDMTPTGGNASGVPEVRPDQTACQARPDDLTLFAVTDQTASLTARGNAAATGTYQRYLTTYLVDNAGTGFNTAPAGGTCSGVLANTGNRCGVDEPAWGGTNVSDGSTATKTRFTYDAHGQRLTMTSPKAIAETPTGQTPPATTYMYYADTDKDLSGTTPAGGWLKGVSDATSTPSAPRFVAFGYDAAGNVVRTWDRNATARAFAQSSSKTLVAYPGTWTAPPSTEYSETLYGCASVEPSAACAASTLPVSRPWRHVRASRDALGNVTSFALDNNGNATAIRPPRGNAAGVATYDTRQTTIDPNDNVSVVTTPIGSNDGTAPAVPGTTTTTYDAFDNVATVTDANGRKTAYVHDAANRKVATRWSRTTDANLAPGGGSCPSTTGDPVFGTAFVCVARTAYDGTGNVIASQDANGQVATTTYDALHRPTARVTRRGAKELRTETRYDADGRVTDACSPREFDPAEPGSAGTCTSTSRYSTHTTYDVVGRAVSTSSYRDGSDGSGPNTVTTTYDADGNVRTTTDARQTVVTSTFDLLDRLVARATPHSATATSTSARIHDPSGNVTAVLEPLTPGGSCAGTTSPATCRITAYSYDALNRVVDTVSGSDNVDAVAAGLPTANGGANIRTRVAYDEDGHVVRTYSPRAFNPYGAQTTRAAVLATPNPAFMAVSTYDANGRIVSDARPRHDAGAASHQGPAGAGTETAQCPVPAAPSPFPAGVGVCMTHYRYDAVGNATLTTLPTSAGMTAAGAPLDARYVRATYTHDNLLATSVAPSPVDGGHTAASYTQRYDGNGNLLRVVRAPLAGDSAGHEHVMEYTEDNLLSRVVAQRDTVGNVDHVTTYTYDAAGNPRSVRDGAGQVVTTTYFADGLVKEECAYTVAGTGCEDGTALPANRLRTTYAYDANGNPESVRSPSGNASTDLNNAANVPVISTFTLDNLLLTTLEPVSPDGASRRRTTYGYDGLGRKTSQLSESVAVAPAGAANLAPPTAVTPVLNGGTRTFTYHPSDRVATESGRAVSTVNGISASGTITTTYDADGNVTSAADSSSGVTTGTCDANGRVTGGTAPALFCATYYLDGLLRSTDDGSRFNAYGYDAMGSRTARLDGPTGGTAAQTATYSYNEAGMLVGATSNLLSGSWSWTYDEAGRPKTQSDPNGAAVAFTWRPNDMLSAKKVTTGAGSVAHWTYTYDAAYRKLTQGLVPADTKGAGEAAPVTGTYTYAYDGAGRLTSFTDQTGTKALTWDPDGNRTQFGAQRFEYRADNSLLSETDPDGANVAVYGHYAWGGVKTDSCRTFAYDGFDRTRTVTGGAKCAPSKPTTFAYDALHRQRSHAENGKPAIAVSYDGASQWIAEDRPAGTGTALTQYVLAPSGAPMAAVNGTTAQVLEDDGDGNIALVLGADASVACTARYDAFGRPEGTTTGDAANATCNTGTTPSDIFWHASRKDQSTGTYQFGGRTYDPGKGAFLTPDSHGAGSAAADLSVGVDPMTRNRYSYVNGDPVNLVDPTGHRACLEACGSEADRMMLARQRAQDEYEMGIQRRSEQWVADQKAHKKRVGKKTAEYKKYEYFAKLCPYGKMYCGAAQSLTLGASVQEAEELATNLCMQSQMTDGGSWCDSGAVHRDHVAEMILIDLPVSFFTPAILGKLGLIGARTATAGGVALTSGDEMAITAERLAVSSADDLGKVVDDVVKLGDDLADEGIKWADEAMSSVPEAGSPLHVLDDAGHALEARATLAPGLAQGTSASVNPLGYAPKSGFHRGHLLAKMFGGTGDDVANLTPLYPRANMSAMKAAENQIMGALKGGQTVKYASRALYTGESHVPIGLTIRAQGSGGLDLWVTIINRAPVP